MLGSEPLGGGLTRFSVWAPSAHRVAIRLLPSGRVVELAPEGRGYYTAATEGAPPGTRYWVVLDGRDRPDPASRYQPEGVHGPSEVVDPSFIWTDPGWCGRQLSDYVIYELHIGTFTAEGTFGAAIGRLDALAELGITAVEIMPIAEFPGGRNWGYDGVFPFAAQSSYGGPSALMAFVDACHRRGLCVILDVVYNHLGPEGNVLHEFGPYFTDRYKTPWGQALNFDGPESDEVRRYFIENARYWTRVCHVDALRLDAVHAICDSSVRPFLSELTEAVRPALVIAESDANDARLVTPADRGGLGLDGVWCDDFHHALRSLLTGERSGYLGDFGRAQHLATAIGEGFVYSGQYSEFRKRRRGTSSKDLPGETLVVCGQNHDQIGNRPFGDRLVVTGGRERQKLAAAAVLLSPYVPLLFMGEEYGESAPFQYFTSHGDRDLIRSVREGRRREFAPFHSDEEAPDPQNEATFRRCKLDPARADPVLADWYKELFRLRRLLLPVLRERRSLETGSVDDRRIVWWRAGDSAFAVLHAGDAPVPATIPVPKGRWTKALDSSHPRWRGPGTTLPAELDTMDWAALPLPPLSFVLYQRKR